jgi:carbon-monoxide dehydrogenase medium subunit
VAVEYRDPERLAEVLDILQEFGEDAKLVAGGQSLMVMLRQGLISPGVLIDLGRVADLAGVRAANGEVQLGAMTTTATIERDPTIRSRYPVLAQAAAAVGPLPVRNVGTIGGSVAHNAPGADSPPALLALDATVTIAGPAGVRSVPIADLFTGYFQTTIGPDEVLTEVTLPPLPAGTHAAYLKFATRAVDMALVGVAVVARLEGDAAADVRIAIGGAGPAPFRARDAEAHLRATGWTDGSLREAGRLAARASSPAPDAHASPDYRRWLVRTLVPRALLSVCGMASAGSEP